MKIAFALLGYIMFTLPVQSQMANRDAEAPVARNTISASFGGAGIYYALNYERLLVQHRKIGIGASTGIGTDFSSALFGREFSLPVGAFILYGKKNGRLELGAGLANYFLKQYDYGEDRHETAYRALFVPSIGYRYQKRTGGFMVKAGFSPVINLGKASQSAMPWFDLGIGWVF